MSPKKQKKHTKKKGKKKGLQRKERGLPKKERMVSKTMPLMIFIFLLHVMSIVYIYYGLYQEIVMLLFPN